MNKENKLATIEESGEEKIDNLESISRTIKNEKVAVRRSNLSKDKGNEIQKIINNAKLTLQNLDESIQSSYKMERTIFQDELKLVIDNQQLLLQLDKEKLKNAQLKRFASSGSLLFQAQSKSSCESNNEIKSLKDRCNILSDVLRKRDCQIRKAKLEIESMQLQTKHLHKSIKNKETKYRRLCNKYRECYLNLKSENDENFENMRNEIDRLQMRLKQQEKQNHNLMFTNNRLKIELRRTKSQYDLFTQVSEKDFLEEENFTG